MAKKKLTQEERDLEKSLSELLRHTTYRCDKQKYNIGDKVYTPMNQCLGGKILDCIENTFYKVNFDYMAQIKYSSDHEKKNLTRWYFCYDLYPMGNKEYNLTREKSWKDYININSMKKSLDCFIDQYTGGYLDLDPSYQRELVWTDNQKESLIDSIFNLKNTGSLTIIQDTNYNYEVLDGKQRLSTVFDFMMDKFRYKGVLFSELDIKDRKTVEYHQFQYSEIVTSTDLTTAEKVELFIDFNTSGTAVSNEHINELKNKYFKKED